MQTLCLGHETSLCLDSSLYRFYTNRIPSLAVILKAPSPVLAWHKFCLISVAWIIDGISGIVSCVADIQRAINSQLSAQEVLEVTGCLPLEEIRQSRSLLTVGFTALQL